MRSSFLACRNNPYWSCMISAQDLNVSGSIPRILRISACVSTILSIERLIHSPFSANWERFSVGFPDFVLVLTTRNRLSPTSQINSIIPDLASAVPRIHAF